MLTIEKRLLLNADVSLASAPISATAGGCRAQAGTRPLSQPRGLSQAGGRTLWHRAEAGQRARVSLGRLGPRSEQPDSPVCSGKSWVLGGGAPMGGPTGSPSPGVGGTDGRPCIWSQTDLMRKPMGGPGGRASLRSPVGAAAGPGRRATGRPVSPVHCLDGDACGRYSVRL